MPPRPRISLHKCPHWRSSENLISATVIVLYTNTTSDMPAMFADALATAVFVMGEDGVVMIDSVKNYILDSRLF
ncbi:MAG TPA: hypothetical protein C5S51_03245 [Methanosarcinaceae archaeon]|nr:hypothetical protein [Methanosarcinaceae archaeon]